LSEICGIGEGTLLSTRWDKTGTKEGHRAVCGPPGHTPLLGRDGLVITGKRAWAIWMHSEPRRCLKCQTLNTNHLADSLHAQGGVWHMQKWSTEWQNAWQQTTKTSGALTATQQAMPHETAYVHVCRSVQEA